MKRMGLAWRLVAWLLCIAWMPVVVEMLLNHFFHVEERIEATILVIPYLEFVTGPLTCFAALIGIFKGAKATASLLRRHNKPESM